MGEAHGSAPFKTGALGFDGGGEGRRVEDGCGEDGGKELHADDCEEQERLDEAVTALLNRCSLVH